MEMDDLQVIEKVKNGQIQDFEKLVSRYQRPLFLYLGRMGVSSAEVDDLSSTCDRVVGLSNTCHASYNWLVTSDTDLATQCDPMACRRHWVVFHPWASAQLYLQRLAVH